VFHAMSAIAREHAGLPSWDGRARSTAAVPYVSEPWYCCAEPMEVV